MNDSGQHVLLGLVFDVMASFDWGITGLLPCS